MTPEELAQLQLDAYNKGDIDLFVTAYSDTVELYDLKSGELTCKGKDQLYTKYADQFEKCPYLNCVLVSRVVCGNFVYDQEKVSGLLPRKVVHAVATYYVENGKIQKAWFAKDN